jgi:hypothetical protein
VITGGFAGNGKGRITFHGIESLWRKTGQSLQEYLAEWFV